MCVLAYFYVLLRGYVLGGSVSKRSTVRSTVHGVTCEGQDQPLLAKPSPQPPDALAYAASNARPSNARRSAGERQ